MNDRDYGARPGDRYYIGSRLFTIVNHKQLVHRAITVSRKRSNLMFIRT